MSKLTPKQQRFVEEYLIDLNATQAALRAGYKPRAAGRTGSENLAKPLIGAAIALELKKRRERTVRTADDVVARLYDIVFADLRQVIEWDDGGIRLKADEEIPDHVHGAIASIKERRTRRVGANKEEWEIEYREVKLVERSPYMKLLMQHLGLLAPENLNINYTDARQQTLSLLDLASLTTDELRALAAGPVIDQEAG